MCGLIFLHDPASETGAARHAAERALAALKHRGPDAQEICAKGHATFAHARLAIVDLDASRQPMHSPDGRYTLVFNGEIYNHDALRRQLAADWIFRTRGDTEVLLAGLIREGTDFLPRLSGMWAFAFWDHAERRLILSRDRMGKKPLYYAMRGNRCAVASELPALRCLAQQPWHTDVDALADYFRYGYCLPGYTQWQDVREVLPAHSLVWQPGLAPSERRYWQLPLPGDAARPPELTLRDTLTAAVARRLVADVEVGAFLSGGIDSSLIAALAQRQMNRPLKTYTIAFADPSYDESPHAAEVAAWLGTAHHCARFPDWAADQLEMLLHRHVGQVFADASLLPTALVSQAAARDVKVALSGDGADELFGGYQRYQARLILRWYSRLPTGLRHLAETALRKLPEPGAHHSRSLLKKAHLFLDIVHRQAAETPYTAPLMFAPEAFAHIFPDLAGRGHAPPGLADQTRLDDLEQMLRGDALVYLPQDILAKVDRASMAHSLETRAPFLDHRVVELAFSRPAKAHLGLGRGKRWLRTELHDLLPQQVWKRRKQGFGVPLHHWFRGELGQRFEQNMACLPGLPFSIAAARALLAEHRSGRRDHGYRLWMLHVYTTFSAA
jgi:asparagine synthase (glutamine-hydrolysing)